MTVWLGGDVSLLPIGKETYVTGLHLPLVLPRLWFFLALDYS